jgi:hypothetical protein
MEFDALATAGLIPKIPPFIPLFARRALNLSR